MNKIRDIDLMQFADGELEVAARPDVEATLAADPDARARLEGVAELGELVRTHLELSADDVERRLGAMWTEIDKRLDLAADAARAIPATATPAAAGPGLWGRLTRWLDAYRGHILTGTLSAGAVAAIALMLRPGSSRARAPARRLTAAPRSRCPAREAPTAASAILAWCRWPSPRSRSRSIRSTSRAAPARSSPWRTTTAPRPRSSG